jgi:hypothetical protein
MFLLLAAVLSLASAAEPVALPGSEVRLPLEPGFVVAERWVGVGNPSIRPVKVGESTARGMLKQVSGLRDVVVNGSQAVVRDGQRGWDHTGTAADATTGAPMVAWQRVMFEADGSYLRVVGMAPAAEKTAWFPAFEAAAGTLRRVPAAP